VLGLNDGGSLASGAPADVTVIDPDVRWTIDPQQFASRSRNTPFAGWSVRGRAERVYIGGELRHHRPAI
jgi:dihydroorotase